MRKQCEKCGLDMARSISEDLMHSKEPNKRVTINSDAKMTGHRHYCIKCHDSKFDCTDEVCEEISEEQLWRERAKHEHKN